MVTTNSLMAHRIYLMMPSTFLINAYLSVEYIFIKQYIYTVFRWSLMVQSYVAP